MTIVGIYSYIEKVSFFDNFCDRSDLCVHPTCGYVQNTKVAPKDSGITKKIVNERKLFLQCYRILLILIHLISFNQSSFAQPSTSLDAPYARPVTFNEEDYLALTNKIKARLAQENGDTSQFYVAQSIVEFCGDNYDCLMNLHHRLRDTMFENRHYLIALALARASVPLASQNNDPFNAGLAYKDMSFYYNDLGRIDSVVATLEKALPYFEKSGACFRIFKVRQELLERKYGDQPEVIVPLMEKNLEDARNMHCDIPSIQHTLKRLTVFTEDGGMWDKFEKYLIALEQTLVPDPTTFEERHAAIYVNFGRAKLYLRETPKQIEKANGSLLKALQITKEMPYPLFGVELLTELAKLEWERQNTDKAFAYLDEAVTLGKENKIYYYLSRAYQTIAQFRETQGHYKEALEAERNQHKYSLEFKETVTGVDLRDYYMQIEKNQMASEQKNKELLLQLKDSQLNNLIYAIVFVALLSLGLLYGFHKQRQRKKELANQNVLIQQQAEQLKSLDAAKSRFFANVSHELRTPLTLLLGPIKSLLKESNMTGKQARMLQTAHQSGKELQQLVNEILDLQKMEAGKMQLDEKPTALVPFFRRYAAQFESLAERKQFDFSFKTPLPETLVASIDQEKCRQILYNLLSNAFKFTPAGGRVTLEIEKLWGEEKQFTYVNLRFPNLPISNFQISVSDTGPGIHPDDLPHLFDRFFQTARPDKPAEGGTGIGLALCHEYAKLFGGKVEVESELGKGSVFRVMFPVKILDGAAVSVDSQQPDGAEIVAIPVFTEANEPAASIPDKSKPTILLVEDNPELQDYIRLILQDKYNVVTAGNGKEAMELMENGKWRMENDDAAFSILHSQFLILSDLMMPVMDGYQLLEKLKASDATRHIPVIMLTARAEARDRLKALRIGVDDYLTKPFEEEELLVRIENLLTNSRNRQAVLEEMTPTPHQPATELPTEGPIISEPDRAWLEGFEAYVQQHLASELLVIPLLAQEFAMSESTLLRQLKRLTGLSPIQYLQEARLDKARQLLEDRSYDSIAKVADKVGYNDARSFSRSFKQRFGKLPSDFLSA